MKGEGNKMKGVRGNKTKEVRGNKTKEGEEQND